MPHQRLLNLERLEDRAVPAQFNVPWHDPSHLSLSFAADGTAIASHTSQLYSALNAQQPTAQWQRAILSAFQSWAVHANVNFGARADWGQAFGTPGLMQGDPRFGDIRIGGHHMSPEVLAIAVPPDSALSGTWSGDVLFNTAYQFNGSPYSLLAVALHEAGHTLGLDNSTNPDAVMYTTYNATRTTLSAEDISRIQALYGARAADTYEGAAGNGSLALASSFRLPVGFEGETPMVAFGDITTQSDADYYKFTFPDDGNDDQHDRQVTVRLQSSGASLLAPRLTVLDQNGQVLATQMSASLMGDTLQVTLTGLSSEAQYYVKVEAATADVFGVGRYGLSVRLDNTSSTSDTVIDKLLSGPYDSLGPDAIDAFFRNSGDLLLSPEEVAETSLAQATVLTPTAGYANQVRYEALASVSKREDIDLYRLTAPAAGGVMTATVWTTSDKDFRPTVTVLNATGQAVAAEVVVQGNGTHTVQVANAAAGQTYYLKVTVDPSAGEDKGNYFVAAQFGLPAAQLRTFAEGTLSASDLEDSTRLYVAQAQLFHFVLNVGNAGATGSVRVTVRDSGNNAVYTAEARAGSSASGGSVLLRPGSYTVVFEILNPNGAVLSYQLRGASLSNPIGPVPIDPTLSAQYTVPPSSSPPGVTYYGYAGFSVPYDPSTLAGYILPGDANTYPPGFTLPPEFAVYPWMVISTDPYYWIALGL